MAIELDAPPGQMKTGISISAELIFLDLNVFVIEYRKCIRNEIDIESGREDRETFPPALRMDNCYSRYITFESIR